VARPKATPVGLPPKKNMVFCSPSWRSGPDVTPLWSQGWVPLRWSTGFPAYLVQLTPLGEEAYPTAEILVASAPE